MGNCLINEKFPSWLFSVNLGATTIWERWDGWTPEKGFQKPGMNSFNHYAYGSCGEWMYARIGAIDLDASRPGYARIIVRPLVAADLHSAQGRRWTRCEVALKRSGRSMTAPWSFACASLPASARAYTCPGTPLERCGTSQAGQASGRAASAGASGRNVHAALPDYAGMTATTHSAPSSTVTRVSGIPSMQ